MIFIHGVLCAVEIAEGQSWLLCHWWPVHIIFDHSEKSLIANRRLLTTLRLVGGQLRLLLIVNDGWCRFVFRGIPFS